MNFQIRGVYSFDVYPSAVLGTSFKNVTIMAIMDFDTANREMDIMAKHVNVYPYLPSNTPNNPRNYQYLKVKTTAGNADILALPWIKEDTVTLIESLTATVTIKNVNAADSSRITQALAMNGFSDVKVEIN